MRLLAAAVLLIASCAEPQPTPSLAAGPAFRLEVTIADQCPINFVGGCRYEASLANGGTEWRATLYFAGVGVAGDVFGLPSRLEPGDYALRLLVVALSDVSQPNGSPLVLGVAGSCVELIEARDQAEIVKVGVFHGDQCTIDPGGELIPDQ